MTTLEKYAEEEIIDFDKQLDKYKSCHKTYMRILAVKLVKLGHTRTEVGKLLNYNRMTVGRWVKNYDEKGFDGLIADYSNCGSECRLTDEQLAELREIITDPNEHYDIKRVQRLIEEKYEVKYSYKQVWVITRQKLKLNYREPNLRYLEAPEDAEEQFKKKLPK